MRATGNVWQLGQHHELDDAQGPEIAGVANGG
jgi:hypothetical protein